MIICELCGYEFEPDAINDTPDGMVCDGCNHYGEELFAVAVKICDSERDNCSGCTLNQAAGGQLGLLEGT